MITFKKGQRVWWDDPAHEKSGEYDVLAVDYAQNIVKIGNGERDCRVALGTVGDYLPGIGRRPVAT